MPLSPDIEAILERTTTALGIEQPKSPEALEACAAYYALQHAGLDAGDAAAAIERVSTGGSDDARLDAIAIIVNGAILTPEHDVNHLRPILESGGEVKALFVCVQATGIDPAAATAPSLTEKLTGFSTGVQTFLFAGDKAKGINESVRGWLDLRNRLFALFDEFDVKNNCALKAYLVWPHDLALHHSHETDIDTFKTVVTRGAAGRFAEAPDFEFVNASGLVRIEQDLRRRGQFVISSALLNQGPDVAGKARIFSGFIPATEFVKMISSEANGERKMLHRLFFDNVRAYLGDDGGVNASIRGTLLDASARREFHLRSNGIAAISRMSRVAGTEHIFEDVQIVNGCQTSYTVFLTMMRHPSEDWSGVQIPMRIVVSSDDDAIDEMILGLNRQGAVDDIQIFSRRDYVIRLFQYFLSQGRNHPESRIWFERRAGEYAHITKQEDRVLSMRDVMGAYGAAFMSKPHLDQDPANLVAAIKAGRLFADRHDPEFYFLAAVMTMRLRQALQSASSRRVWPGYGAKAQLIHGLRLLVDREAGVSCPQSRFGSSARSYLDAISKVVLDPAKVQLLSGKARDVVALAETTARDESGKLLSGNLSRKASLAAFTRRVEDIVQDAANGVGPR